MQIGLKIKQKFDKTYLPENLLHARKAGFSMNFIFKLK
jgi:hypothetical protein